MLLFLWDILTTEAESFKKQCVLVELKMRSIKIWLVGGITGTFTSLFFHLAILILSIDDEIGLSEGVIALITPAIVAVLVARATNSKTITLLIVAYLTLAVPILGSIVGDSDFDIGVLGVLVALGLVGGLVWSTPFALLAFKRRKNAD